MIEATLQSHLTRLLFASGVSLIVGLLLCLRAAWRPFGVMTAAWGAIDVAIALASRGGGPKPLSTLVPFVALNEGLNAGYVGVGLAMILLSGERKMIEGFGLAVAIQGALLLILDGKLWGDLARLT